MYSLSDILSCSLKNETPERSSCNEQSSATLSLNDTLGYSMESGQLKNPPPRAHSELDYQRGPSSLTTTHLVSLQGEISSQEDILKFQKRKVQETTYNKKWFKYDLAHRKRETSTSSTCSTATLISRTSAYPVDFSGEITSQDGIQMNNTMSTYKKASPLPLKSANPLPSRDDIYSKRDNLPIQISKVYENPYNKKAVKAFIDDLTKKQCNFPLINGRNHTSGDSTLEAGISSPEQLRKNQPIKDNRAYPKEKDAKSFTNGSVNWSTVHFTKTTAPQRDFSRSPTGCKRPNFQTPFSPYQRRDQDPENTGSTTLSVHKSDTQGDYLHNNSLEIIPCYHIYNIKLSSPNDENSNFTIPPQHIRLMEEITAQQEAVAKNLDVYQPESSLFNQKGIQLSHKGISGISTNLDRLSASNSEASRQEQPALRQAFDPHPTPSLGNRRPSVIMVPASWSSIHSRESHVPLKVNDVPSSSLSLCHMGNVVELDSSDEDEKYLRVNMDGKTATFKLTKEDWKRIPISTFPSGGRLLSGDWRKIFVNKVKESNPWCSLRFKNNHVRSENSRKLYSAVFFRGAAECKRPECNVKVRFVIQKEKGKYVDVTYVGNVCHSSQPGGGGVVNYRIRRKQIN